LNELTKTPESVKVLDECIKLQLAKSADYQSKNSSVRQADYYPRGLETLYDICWAKMLRIRSVLDKGEDANFESVEDSFKDLINYASFAVSWNRGRIDGQEIIETTVSTATECPVDNYPPKLYRSDDGEVFTHVSEGKYVIGSGDINIVSRWSYDELMSTGKFQVYRP